MKEERTFTAAEVSAIVQRRLKDVKTPAALVDLTIEALNRCDALEQRIEQLERNQAK